MTAPVRCSLLAGEAIALRLHLKITLWIVVILLGLGGISVYTLIYFQRTAALQQFEAMAKTLTETIRHSLYTTMLHNNPTEMQEIIRHIRREAVIHRVAIYTPDGRVWASSNADELGTYHPSSLLGKVVTSGVPMTEERRDARELIVLTPIQNLEECQSCHPARQRILGATAVSLGTEHVEVQLRNSARLLTGLVGFTFLLALGTLSVLLGRFVLEPLSNIVSTVREVSRGNYGARASVQSTDELGELAAAFNDMSGRIEHYTSALSEKIEDLTRRLSTLTIFSQTLTEAEDVAAAMAEAAAAFREMVRGDACVVYRADNGSAVIIASAGERSLVAPWGAEVVARTACGQPVSSPPGPADVNYTAAGVGALLAVPLRIKERTLGGIVLARCQSWAFEPADLTLLTTVASHLATAMENLRLFQEVKDKERLRGELLSKLIRAHEDERFRIARELHDEVSQSLTGLMMRLNVVEEAAPQNMAQVRSALSEIRAVTENAVEEVRKIIFDLRPTLLDDLGLIPAVRYYAKTLLETAGMEVQFQAAGFGQQRLPPAVETTVFRVAQEAMTNVARHSHARIVTVSLELAGDQVRLRVVDDGVGFDPTAMVSTADRRRLGIAGMQERVTLLGGSLQITSAPGTGTTVLMVVPAHAGAVEAA